MEKDATSDPSIYVASPLGFSEAGSRYLDEVLHPALSAAGFSILDPWSTGAAIVRDARGAHDPRAVNAAIGAANAELIRSCDGALAVLDGTDVDSGTAAEIGFASALGKPVVGLRTDFRMAGDNPDTPINLQVLHFLTAHGGTFTTTAEAAIVALRTLFDGRVRHARLFHVADRTTWASAKLSGSYASSTRDQSLEEVGFIHCSYGEQVLGSAERFYADADLEDVVVLVVDPARLEAPLVPEAAGNGELYPHIYGPLNPGAVVAVRPLLRRDGSLTLGAASKS